MIYVFLGTEINLINKKINDLIKESEIQNIIKYDFDNSKLIDIINESNYIDLFNEKKFIIVSNFSFKKIKDSEEKELINYINNQNDNIIVIKCIDETLDNRKSIIKELNEKCKINKVEKLSYNELEPYLIEIFKSNNKKIKPYQIKKIMFLSQYNADYAVKEIEKLLLYKINDEEITDEDIDLVISKNPEKELYRLSDAVVEKDLKEIFDSFKIVSEMGIKPEQIVESLASQFRLMYQVKILLGTMSPKELSYKLAKGREFIVTKAINTVKKYKETDLLDLIYKLSEVDYKIKSFNTDKQKLLEDFFVKI